MNFFISFILPFTLRSRLYTSKLKNISNALVPYICEISYNTLRKRSTMTDKLTDVFQGKIDHFKGVTVHSEKEECTDIDEFSKKLEDSLKLWKETQKRGIWFRVHLKHAYWVPVLAKKGFKFHHAHEEHVMMYLWLPTSENCNIPRYAHTMIGVGAVVVNDKSQVLVVKEKYRINNRTFWKLPGGYVDYGENLVDAAIREVFEETNISTKFHSVLTFRHTHEAMFGCSDIYAVVSLAPLTEKIKKCEREIEDCKWMHIEEYLIHPEVHELNRFFLQKYLEYKEKNIKVNCFHGIHEVIKKPYTIYSVTKHKIDDTSNNEDS